MERNLGTWSFCVVEKEEGGRKEGWRRGKKVRKRGEQVEES